MPEEVTPKPSLFRRILRSVLWPLRHLRLFIVLFVALVVALMLYNGWLMYRVAQVREEVQAAGGMVSIEALNIPGLNDANNAAIPYRHANAVLMRTASVHEVETALEKLQRQAQPLCMPKKELSRRDSEAGLEQPITSEEQAALARYIQDTETAMSFVDEAGQLPHFRLAPEEYAPGQVPVVPINNGMRHLGRHLGYRVQYFLQASDYDQAMHWSQAILRLAQHLQQEPFLINGLIQSAVTLLAIDSLRSVLETLPEDVPVPREMMETLGQLRRLDTWVHTIESERLYPITVHQQMAAGPMKFIFLRSEISMHGQVGTIVSALRAPDFATQEIILAPLRAQADQPVGSIIWDLSQITLPAYVRSLDGHFRAVAKADQATIAIALRAHKLTTGSYPEPGAEGLDFNALFPVPAEEEGGALPASPPRVPVDPFSGRPYQYKREGEGYRLWSYGLDRDDDGGVPGERANEGDIVWCMEQ